MGTFPLARLSYWVERLRLRASIIVYGCADPKGGGAGSVFNLVDDARLNHRIEVYAGVLGDEAADMLRAFFQARRAAQEL